MPGAEAALGRVSNTPGHTAFAIHSGTGYELVPMGCQPR